MGKKQSRNEDKMNQNSQYNFDGNDHTGDFDPKEIKETKLISSLAYFGVLFFLPLVCCPNSRFGKFHANQGLVLFIAEMILGTVVGAMRLFMGFVPFFGRLFGGLLNWAVGIVFLVFIIVGIINTLGGRAKELPVIGRIKILS